MIAFMRQYSIRFIFILLITACYCLPVRAENSAVYIHNNVVSFSSLLSADHFNKLFPLRDKFYSYASLLKAVHNLAQLKIKIEKRGPYLYRITRSDKVSGIQTVVREDKDWNEPWAKQKEYSLKEIDYSSFCNSSDPIMNKRELAAFFAQAAHETRHGKDGDFRDGLMLKQELSAVNGYLTDNQVYPAAEGKKYYGRGPLQLSYNGNYGAASEVIFGDKNKLLADPDLVTKDAVTAFETAIYFWMTPQAFKPSSHEVITGTWNPSAEERKRGWTGGFGMVTNIINGTIECNQGDNLPPMKNRIDYYRYFLKGFGVTDPRPCSCGLMQPFK